MFWPEDPQKQVLLNAVELKMNIYLLLRWKAPVLLISVERAQMMLSRGKSWFDLLVTLKH